MSYNNAAIIDNEQIKKAGQVYDALKKCVPVKRNDLKNYVKVFLGIQVPDKKICDGHCSPMDYLWHSYGSDLAGSDNVNSDSVVWANRGGGKTELAAVATLLDCLFKPNCSVRILGGSGEQSSRMYEYLTAFVRKGFKDNIAGNVLKEKCRFLNESSVEILTQSARNVRGRHVNKLRCDEVELFDKDVFNAAKFITQSKNGITAGMEIISTMHRPYGLMHEAVVQAEATKTPTFKWCVWEVIEKCADRGCSQCKLWSDCRGRAKKADGYFKIDDCITQMSRASRAGFESEMLCLKPNIENAVFADFDTAVHVGQVEYDKNLPLYRAIDFGYVNPFVCLWVQVDQDGTVRVIDEYYRSRAAVAVHAANIKKITPCREEAVAATYCDPAGAGVNDVTGTSSVKELRAMGIQVSYKRSRILEGIELIRRALRAGDGQRSIVISPRCARLIEAMRCYHYPDEKSPAEVPEKDGVYDHPIDALRYFFVNYKSRGKISSRRY